MELHSYTAKTAEEAIRKVREALGPDAVIEKVVRVPPEGMARLWKGPGIQVFARTADGAGKAPVSEYEKIARQVEYRETPTPVEPRNPRHTHSLSGSDADHQGESGQSVGQTGSDDFEWSVAEILQASGVLPQYAMEIVEKLQHRFGRVISPDHRRQMQMIRLVLEESWRPYVTSARQDGVVHIFTGPAATGKTAVMCKWLTHHRLVENRPVRAFLLNTERAHVNTDQLSLHCDILGIPVERYFPESRRPSAEGEAWFVDLPGVDMFDSQSVGAVGAIIREFDHPEIHLVLNLAYESPVFLGQLMSMKKARVTPDSLIFTHLDEESRWGKIWNAVFAARLPISFFSTGQNIPGDFVRAGAEMVMRQQFPS